MANFTPTKHEANEYNGGVQYIDSNPAQGIEGDGLQAQTVNNLVESSLYSQQQAESAVATANSANDTVNNFIASQDAPPPVGYHYIQYNGEPTPAQRWAGTTWEIDTAYQGKVLIGSGGTYTLGATGGELTHNHEAGNLYTRFAIFTSYKQVVFNTKSVSPWAAQYTRDITISANSQERDSYEGMAIGGGTANADNMPPYAVVNYWKRTA